MITVYTTGPECQKCNVTKKQFEKGGVPFEEVLLTPEKAGEYRDRGMGVAPIVVTETETWFDLRADKIREVVKQYRTAA